MTDEHDPQQEPVPGSTEWLLAQLSGGRIDSRRERREAEAALEARGVQLPETITGAISLPSLDDDAGPNSGESPTADESPTAYAAPGAVNDTAPASSDERPKARFSWETGTLHAVEPAEPDATEGRQADGDPEPATAPEADDGRLDAPQAPDLTFDRTFSAPTAPDSAPADPAAGDETEVPFRWNLLPTADADPALNPRIELPDPPRPAPTLAVPAAAPLIAPKPIFPAEAAPAPDSALTADAAHVPDEAPTADATPAADAVPTADAAPAADADAQKDALPQPPLLIPPPAGPPHPPLPPGTTAHEFDPFAQDLFAPPAATGTPVPSVDEFTIPDEEREAQASVSTQAMPTQGSPAGAPQAGNAPTQQAAASGPGAEADGARAAADRDAQVSSEWTDIADMLGAHPETVENSIVPEWPPPEGTFEGFAQAVAPAADVLAQAVGPVVAARQASAGSDIEPAAPRRRPPVNRWLLIVVIVLAIVLIAVVLFTVGRAVASGRQQTPAAATSHSAVARPSASVTPSPVVTPSATPAVSDTPALPPTGTLPAGQTYQWDQLRGGECIDPFGGAWAQQYAVVDCDSQHAAQLVYTAPYSADPAAAFPGEAAIASQINLLCSKPGVVDMTAAGAYSDVQLVASYPVTAAQWAAGQRNYYCFVTRASGQPLTSSVQGPGPGQ
ncbi:hypothetical protein ACFOYW_10320 [Gryllotalpicola reticulitermitis]|uniref:Septum formation-related domain-containing protein n=1 Tax=Gryllotalpicola reticulitermitis TaxID=1184153 RepID=A0ABV8Q8G6_9MICO